MSLTRYITKTLKKLVIIFDSSYEDLERTKALFERLGIKAEFVQSGQMILEMVKKRASYIRELKPLMQERKLPKMYKLILISHTGSQ